MSFDFRQHLGVVDRSVASLERDGTSVRAVTLARTYDTTVDDLWDAATNSQRLPRWFAPVEGELKLGGRFKIQGNAEGTIRDCEPPSLLSMTWEYGGETSWVEVRMAREGSDRSRLTLTHHVPVNEHWKKYGPGAVGVGWELGLAGLERHLSDVTAEPMDEQAFWASPEGKAFMSGSGKAWGEAHVEAGEATEQAHAAAAATVAAFTGDA